MSLVVAEAGVPGDGLLIIGAGPSGLSLGRHYSGRKRILERDTDVGGLCRSIEIGGGVFDIGGHSFHTPHSEVHALVQDLMRGNWSVQQRDARVYFDGQLIPYPFQAHFEMLETKLWSGTVAGQCHQMPQMRRTSKTGLLPASVQVWPRTSCFRTIVRFGRVI